LKKSIVKNYLQGLEEGENISSVSSSGGEQVTSVDVSDSLSEFGGQLEKEGLTKTANAYGLSRLAKELGEVATFKRKNGIDLEDMLRGGKIARVLKNYNVGIPELEQFLSVVYSRASEHGYNAETIVSQVTSLSDLEKKLGSSYEELEKSYEKLGSEIESKQEEKKKVLREIEEIKKQKTELLAKNKLDEAKIEDYLLTKQKLASFGLDPNDLEGAKNFLYKVKVDKFDPGQIISKLNTLEDLNKERAKLEQQISSTEDELHKKKALVNEIKRLEDSKLSIDQIERFQKVVTAFSKDKNVDPAKAYAQFEEDILKHYNAVQGLNTIINQLKENEKRLKADAESTKQTLIAEEALHSDKLKKIEERYSKLSSEINAYNSLKEKSGIDSQKITTWYQIIEASKLDASQVESQLKNYASLKNLEKEISQKVVTLMSEAESLKAKVETLEQQKAKTESSIKALSDTAIAEVDSASSKILSSLTSLNDQAKATISKMSSEYEKSFSEFRAASQRGFLDAVEDSKKDLKGTVGSLNSTVEEFSSQLRKALDEATPQLKNVELALEAGEKIGKYRNIMPLLELLDDKNLAETDALIAMWNVGNRFSTWMTNHYRLTPKDELSQPLSKLLASLSDEIQRVNH
jgi:chromosome segregation ATPase